MHCEYAAGYCKPCRLVLPVAAQIVMPALAALTIAFCSVVEPLPPPRLRLTTFALFVRAWLMPFAIHVCAPLPLASSTRTGMIVHACAMPATPTELLVT